MKLNEKKEALPVEFITSAVSQGWSDVGTLKASIEGLKKDFSGAAEIVNIMQDFLDSYLIYLGRLEGKLDNKKYLDMPEEKQLKEALEDDIEVIEDDGAVLEEPEDEELVEEDCVTESAKAVMTAYQNANKWLDSVKEVIYTQDNCPFFASFVHELAHTMPERFDKFGDILHTVDMEIPYPETAEIPQKPTSIINAFDTIFMVLDNIKSALNAFIKCTDEEYHGMSCAAEACLNDIESEYPMLYRLQAKAKECGEDTVSFDKFVGQYVEHKDDLLESYEEETPAEKSSKQSDPFKYFTDFDDVELDTTQPSLHEQWINK